MAVVMGSHVILVGPSIRHRSGTAIYRHIWGYVTARDGSLDFQVFMYGCKGVPALLVELLKHSDASE